MAKLVIKKKENTEPHSKGLLFSDYHTTVDGVEISQLSELKISMGDNEVNSCSMTFLVDDVEIDANFIAAVKAHIKTRD